nr:MAG TPA: Mundticin KS immunity protein four-helix bundle, ANTIMICROBIAL PROTEIN.8A [Caudoviricetes sp.]
MDIEKLDINAVCFGILCNFTPVCGEERAKEAVELVRTLQAENEKLRAELEQVKRERDAAVSDLTFVVNQYRLETTGIDLCGLCEYDLPPVGENGQTAECPGFYVNDCFKWRGPEEG